MKQLFHIKSLWIIPFLYAVLIVACYAEDEKELELPQPKVILDHGKQEDADAALKVLRQFLSSWEAREYSDALKEVYSEPDLREGHKKEMKKRPFKLQRIEYIRLSKRKNVVRARIHVAAAPSPSRADLKKRVIGIDMTFLDGRWWIAGG